MMNCIKFSIFLGFLPRTAKKRPKISTFPLNPSTYVHKLKSVAGGVRQFTPGNISKSPQPICYKIFHALYILFDLRVFLTVMSPADDRFINIYYTKSFIYLDSRVAKIRSIIIFSLVVGITFYYNRFFFSM